MSHDNNNNSVEGKSESHQLGIKEICSYESRLIQKWADEKTYVIEGISSKPKYYVLVMFPYPSGKIHMGHVRNYSLGDVLARYKRLRGFHVLHPIGWDSFGLPAENAAIKNNIPPAKWTRSNIDTMRVQLQRMGFSYDWCREVATCTPEYYRWNQYIFLQFFEKGWAYKKEALVNWCEQCNTVLANEQVTNGACWRHEDQKIKKKELSQWFFKITDFAEPLLKYHENLQEGWPKRVLAMQKNWIGKSTGTLVYFKVKDWSLEVFTTRIDTLFGVTYIAVAPEHPLLEKIENTEIKRTILDFKNKVLTMSEIEREDSDLKEGLFTGLKAKHPLLDKEIPIYTANFVLPGYGTGAVMSVPAHDQRDFEFAQKYNIPIIRVIAPTVKEEIHEKILSEAFVKEGFLIHSGEYTGLSSKEAKEQITQKLDADKMGNPQTEYRLRDWLISRQRYWGTPIPIVYCDDCGIVPEDQNNLPVILPQNIAFDHNKNSLVNQESFRKTNCPRCNKKARRETDTMDTFVDSSWYFLRYTSPNEKESPFDYESAQYFMPVDKCIGGIEHANMHLLYARYFTHALSELGLLDATKVEPFKNLLTQGMVLKDGKAMSKSLGNIVDPDELVQKYGADTLRLFSLFAAPAEKDLDWSEFAVEGSFRMIKRLYRFIEKKRAPLDLVFTVEQPEIDLRQTRTFILLQETHRMIKFITDELERFSCNTSIARLMEMLNFYYLHYFEKKKHDFEPKEIYVLSFSVSSFLSMLMPFAPFISLELLFRMGLPKEEELSWPTYQEKYFVNDTMTIVIQINGKTRSQLDLDTSLTENNIISLAKVEKKIATYLTDKKILRSIYVPQKLVNFVI